MDVQLFRYNVCQLGVCMFCVSCPSPASVRGLQKRQETSDSGFHLSIIIIPLAEREWEGVEQHQGIAGGKINESMATEPQETEHRKSIYDVLLFVVQVFPPMDSVSPFLTSSTQSESLKQQQQQQGQRGNSPPLDPIQTFNPTHPSVQSGVQFFPFF